MEDAKRIYSLLLRSNGLKIREIAQALELEKLYVAELLFSEECNSFWYQNDDSLWFAKNDALEVEEEEGKNNAKDPLFDFVVNAKPLNIKQYKELGVSGTAQNIISDISNYRLFTDDQTHELFQRYRDGDKKAYEQLIEGHLRYVVAVARLFMDKGVPLEDLIQEGTFGLITAIEYFDHTRYNNFTWFAKTKIYQTLSLATNDLQHHVKIPQRHAYLHARIREFCDKYEQENGFEPPFDDVEIENVDLTDFYKPLFKLPQDLSDVSISMDDWDSVADDTYLADKQLITDSEKFDILRLVQMLPQRERQYVEEYYGLNGRQAETLDEIGRKNNLTRERIRQIVAKSIRTLKKLLKIRKQKKDNDSSVIEETKNPEKSIIGNQFENPITDEGRIAFLPSTQLKRLVDLKILTKIEWKHCKKKGLHTIGDVKLIIQRYQLTRESTRFTRYTLDIWFRIVDLLPKNLRKVETKELLDSHDIIKPIDYEKLFTTYSQKILKIRQAIIFGEVVVAKPVLLLALIDGIKKGHFGDNRFVLNEWLESHYNSLMKKYTRSPYFTGIDKPFWHLENDGFWHLNCIGEQPSKDRTPSKNWLKSNVQYCSFDDDLWILLKNPIMLQRLCDFIIENKLQSPKVEKVKREVVSRKQSRERVVSSKSPSVQTVHIVDKTRVQWDKRTQMVIDAMRWIKVPKTPHDIALMLDRTDWGGIPDDETVDSILKRIPEVEYVKWGKYILKENKWDEHKLSDLTRLFKNGFTVRQLALYFDQDNENIKYQLSLMGYKVI